MSREARGELRGDGMTFADIADFEEDKRIDIIGHRVTVHKEVVAFIVEDDVKADRYVHKLKEKFPTISETSRGPGPVEGTICVKVAELQ